MSKGKKLIGLLLATVLAFNVVGCGKKENSVAVVNGEEITRAELDQRMAKMRKVYEGQGADFKSEQGKQMLKSLESQILDGMIEEEILLQEADKRKLVPSDKDVEKNVEETKSKFGNEQQFNDALKNYNMDLEGFKDWTRTNIAMDKLYEEVTKDIKVSEKEMKEYFEQNKDQFGTGEQVRAKHILIKFDTAQEKVGRTEEQALAEAKKVLAEYKTGADFAELAKKYSEDPGSKDKGGEYTFPKGQMVPEFENAAFGLAVGKVTEEPVKTAYGYHLIKLEEKIAAKIASFEESKDKVQQQILQQKKQDAFTKFTQDLKAKAKIENNLPAPPAPPTTGGPSGGGQGGSMPPASGEKPANHP